VRLGQWIFFGIPTGYSGRGAGFSAWTFSLFINDIVGKSLLVITIYMLMMLNFILAATLPHFIARLNEDLDRIHQWSMANRLFINSSKSQAMIINPPLLPIDVSPQNRLGADVIPCYKKLKNLGLLINQDLTWDGEVNNICRNVSYTLRRLWPMADFTPVATRRKLVTTLNVPQFLYCDIIFCKTSMRLRERLKLAFNSCARYIYSIFRYKHISPFANMILGVPLDTYYIVFGYAVRCSD
jgi:hypothetical protein